MNFIAVTSSQLLSFHRFSKLSFSCKAPFLWCIENWLLKNCSWNKICNSPCSKNARRQNSYCFPFPPRAFFTIFRKIISWFNPIGFQFPSGYSIPYLLQWDLSSLLSVFWKWEYEVGHLLLAKSMVNSK